MAAGNIIEVDESGEKFWIPKDRIPLICGETPHLSFISQTLIPILSAVMPKVEDCFKEDGPYGKFSLYTASCVLESKIFLMVSDDMPKTVFAVGLRSFQVRTPRFQFFRVICFYVSTC